MISCTEFIPAYSELFKYLEQRGGKQAVVGFWEYISDEFLGNFRSLIEEHGLRGCWLYWSHTLNEEAADFTMELDEELDGEAGLFTIDMQRCPSKGGLLENQLIEPYHDYCGHCTVLYGRVLESRGFEYECDLSQCDEAKCRLVVRSKPT